MTTDPEKTVFISYRRSVSAHFALLVFKDLCSHGYDVFMDVESIASGTFDTIILNQIAAQAHFVVILSPGSLERCVEPEDWLRREIEHAMALGRNIVPVLAHDFRFEDYKDCLTGKLSELPRYNALNVPDGYFDAAMERLRERFLKQPMSGDIRPTPAGEQATVRRKVEEAASRPPPTEEQLTAEQWLARGNKAYNEGDCAQAIESHTKAIELDPQYALAYYNRGLARQTRGDLAGAIDDYTEAIRLAPQLAPAYNNRGLARHVQGDLEGAIDDYNEAIRLEPQGASAYNNRGLTYRAQGDLEGAIADFTEAIRLDPTQAWFYHGRGDAHQVRGDLEGAINDYNKAIRLDPQYAWAYNNRGETEFTLGQMRLALSDFERAYELDPAYKWAIAGLAITLHALGHVEEALQHWRSLIAKDARYRDADWVGKELSWRPELVEEARKLIEKL